VTGWFLFYRLGLAVSSFGILVGSIVREWDRETAFSDRGYLQFWPIYLTNLAFLGLTAHLFLSTAVLIQRLLERPVKMNWLLRISWLSYNTVTSLGLGLTIAFWAFGGGPSKRFKIIQNVQILTAILTVTFRSRESADYYKTWR
jgi:hypothetical protein